MYDILSMVDATSVWRVGAAGRRPDDMWRACAGWGRDLTRAGAVLFGAGFDVALAHEWSRGAALGCALKEFSSLFGICSSTNANCGISKVRWKHSPGW